MITYKDMTFCINRDCKKECYRKYTDEVQKSAEESGMPWVAVADFDCEDKND